MTRLILAAALLCVLAPSAAAQTTEDPSPEHIEFERLRANARDFHVITVLRQGTGYVYDVDGWDEDEIVLRVGGSLILRAPGIDRVMLVAESLNTRETVSTLFASMMTREEPTSQLNVFYDPSTRHRVRALVCTAPGDGGACDTWTEARPLSGGNGLEIQVIGATGYSSPDRNKARDDG